MLFSEIGEIRAYLCTIEACADKRQVIKHFKAIEAKAALVITKLEGDQK